MPRCHHFLNGDLSQRVTPTAVPGAKSWGRGGGRGGEQDRVPSWRLATPSSTGYLVRSRLVPLHMLKEGL